ncbi:hypothetical protein FDI24_gp196 [Acidovorax phage ACP17]|uniref:Uncharacterized protein n=1 Tax=Acidovorax phage ACP17 TaxID=2010329 RepID=A0A218M360_9CAUD|nr:hypothetical protein FDI24_gp196 [Acidovorax phage ACP17]ASD50477.1 hypothetical protein [Acidovorax phage ACP17]
MEEIFWRPLEELSDMDECMSILVLRRGNEAADTIVTQAQLFEGSLYPDDLDFCADYEDRIQDAIAWMYIPRAFRFFMNPGMEISYDPRTGETKVRSVP